MYNIKKKLTNCNKSIILFSLLLFSSKACPTGGVQKRFVRPTRSWYAQNQQKIKKPKEEIKALKDQKQEEEKKNLKENKEKREETIQNLENNTQRNYNTIITGSKNEESTTTCNQARSTFIQGTKESIVPTGRSENVTHENSMPKTKNKQEAEKIEEKQDTTEKLKEKEAEAQTINNLQDEPEKNKEKQKKLERENDETINPANKKTEELKSTYTHEIRPLTSANEESKAHTEMLQKIQGVVEHKKKQQDNNLTKMLRTEIDQKIKESMGKSYISEKKGKDKITYHFSHECISDQININIETAIRNVIDFLSLNKSVQQLKDAAIKKVKLGVRNSIKEVVPSDGLQKMLQPEKINELVNQLYKNLKLSEDIGKIQQIVQSINIKKELPRYKEIKDKLESDIKYCIDSGISRNLPPKELRSTRLNFKVKNKLNNTEKDTIKKVKSMIKKPSKFICSMITDALNLEIYRILLEEIDNTPNVIETYNLLAQQTNKL